MKLGLPDLMGAQHWTAEQLAAELGLSAPHLLRFLRGLVTLGICAERSDGGFSLTDLGRSLASGSPSRLGEKVTIVVEQYWQPWANLLHTLRNGEPAFEHVFGTDVWAWRNENFRGGDIFAAYLAGETFAQAGPIVEALDLVRRRPRRRHRRRSRRAARRDPQSASRHARHPLRPARDHYRRQEVSEVPWRVRSRNPRRRRLPRRDPVEADLYVLESVLQHWDDVAARAILESCRDAMPARAKLAIIERLLPEAASGDPSAVMIDLHMMVITGGRVRTLAEFERLLAEANLALSKVHATSSGLSVIEAVPA